MTSSPPPKGQGCPTQRQADALSRHCSLKFEEPVLANADPITYEFS